MGEWKAQLSLRVRQALREDLEAIAAREHRKLGNLSELVLEWGYEQLKEAGNIEWLLRCRLRLPEEPPQQGGTQRRPNGKCPMDKGNVGLSVSVRESVWKGFKPLAEQERRKINEVAVDVLEWSVARLIDADSMPRVLGSRIDLPGCARH